MTMGGLVRNIWAYGVSGVICHPVLLSAITDTDIEVETATIRLLAKTDPTAMDLRKIIDSVQSKIVKVCF